MHDLNSHNLSYYSKNGTEGVPNILATAIPIQESIRLEIESRITGDPIKILELGFGSRPDRYIHILNKTRRHWEVYLSDFSYDVLPSTSTLPNNLSIEFKKLKFNLLTDPFPDMLFDVILSTYVFDSIEFPEDVFRSGQHYPGGLVEFAKKSITHLKPGGFFLTIDKWSKSPTLEFQSAGGAKFKSLDLETAMNKLKESCPLSDVGLLSLNDLLEKHHQTLPIDLSDHGCLMIG